MKSCIPLALALALATLACDVPDQDTPGTAGTLSISWLDPTLDLPRGVHEIDVAAGTTVGLRIAHTTFDDPIAISSITFEPDVVEFSPLETGDVLYPGGEPTDGSEGAIAVLEIAPEASGKVGLTIVGRRKGQDTTPLSDAFAINVQPVDRIQLHSGDDEQAVLEGGYEIFRLHRRSGDGARLVGWGPTGFQLAGGSGGVALRTNSPIHELHVEYAAAGTYDLELSAGADKRAFTRRVVEGGDVDWDFPREVEGLFTLPVGAELGLAVAAHHTEDADDPVLGLHGLLSIQSGTPGICSARYERRDNGSYAMFRGITQGQCALQGVLNTVDGDATRELIIEVAPAETE